MKKVKQYKKWAIYENNKKESIEYGFSYTVIHPNCVGLSLLNPSDSDWECNSLEEAIEWIENY